MKKTRNANDFLLSIRGVKHRLDTISAPQLESLKIKLEAKNIGIDSKEILEAHSRRFFIDEFFQGLNWSLKSSELNLLPEVPVRSEKRSTRRFLDYLGFEKTTEHPLLIIETKRPKMSLPRRSRGSTLNETLSRGLRGLPLNSEWDEWLRDLADYVTSIQTRLNWCPKRACITNGTWFVIFQDPYNAFIETKKNVDNTKILILEDFDQVQDHFAEIFLTLEYQNVVGSSQPLESGNIAFHISSEDVIGYMHGIKLRYITETGIYQESPVIKVAPIILLKTIPSCWIVVEKPPNDLSLPINATDLKHHLKAVEEIALDLLEKVNSELQTTLPPISLTMHFSENEGFEQMPAIRDLKDERYQVLTGTETHYLREQSSVPNCVYHKWNEADKIGMSSPENIISRRLVQPRSFFFSGEEHHCAHSSTSTAKASQITAQNKERCGSRSGQSGEAFCEIWRFEEYLCCRTCVFEEICTGAEVFNLPCSRILEQTITVE